jgi:BirA family biotin operon repressor/biotin-[acetyl-CoA-carboxylase] ligase
MDKDLQDHLFRENPTVFHLSEVASTQNWLKEVISAGSFLPGTAVFADFQTSGRGRPGNKWHHLPGNLAMSIWMPKSQEGRFVPWTILTAYSVLAVLEAAMGKAFGIKYPNDLTLLASGEKLGGILVESLGERGELIGIGLNRDDPALSNVAGMTRPGRPLPPDPMALPLLIQDQMLLCFSRQVSEREIRSFLEDRLLWRGEWVTWSDGGSARMGKILGFGDKGHLRILDPQGVESTLPVTIREVRRITP